MGKTLAKIAVSLKEIQSRGDDFLATMERLDNNFWNETSGSWNRYYSGIDMLAELAQADAAAAGQRVSGWDGAENAAVLRGIESAKADCLKISKAYWLTVKRVQGVRNEVLKLKRTCDDAVTKKAKKIKKSESIDELRALSKQLETYANTIDTACLRGPHKPDHKLLQ